MWILYCLAVLVVLVIIYFFWYKPESYSGETGAGGYYGASMYIGGDDSYGVGSNPSERRTTANIRAIDDAMMRHIPLRDDYYYRHPNAP